MTFNKATAATLAGAIVTGAAAIWGISAELQGAIQTILTALLVYFVPNAGN